MKAIWKDTVIAESNATVAVEDEYYFPASSVNMEYLENSDYHTTSPRKGEVNYYHLVVNGERNENAAWYYPNPQEAVQQVEDYIAFGRGVEVTE